MDVRAVRWDRANFVQVATESVCHEIICAFAGLDAFGDAASFPPELFPVSHLGFPQPVLELD